MATDSSRSLYLRDGGNCFHPIPGGMEGVLLTKDQKLCFGMGGRAGPLYCSSALRTEVPLTFCVTQPDLLSAWGLALHPCSLATLNSKPPVGRPETATSPGYKEEAGGPELLCGLELVQPIRLYRTGLQLPCKDPVGPQSLCAGEFTAVGGLSQLIGGLLVVVEILELGWLECRSCLQYITIEHLTSISSSIKWVVSVLSAPSHSICRIMDMKSEPKGPMTRTKKQRLGFPVELLALTPLPTGHCWLEAHWEASLELWALWFWWTFL